MFLRALAIRKFACSMVIHSFERNYELVDRARGDSLRHLKANNGSQL